MMQNFITIYHLTSINSSSTASLFPYTESRMFFKFSLFQLNGMRYFYFSIRIVKNCHLKFYLCLTRSKSAEAIPRCFNKKSNNQSSGSKSLILQSSTIALLFIPPAQFSNTSPLTRSLAGSGSRKGNHGSGTTGVYS